MGFEAGSIPNGWAQAPLEAVCQIFDSRRIPVNSKERSRRISGKSVDELYPYYGATGEVGKIDDFIFEGDHVLLGEDGAPFHDPFKVKSYLVSGKFWVNNHAHILKPTILNKYLCHYLNQIDLFRPRNRNDKTEAHTERTKTNYYTCCSYNGTTPNRRQN